MMEKEEMKDGVRSINKVIVAMKGHPGTGKTTLARSIASSLKCALIDKDDVRDCTSTLQHSLLMLLNSTDAASKILNDLSYDVVWQVALTQLMLGLSVVIDSPLSRQAHLDRLMQLAASTSAQLVIVECKPQDEDEWRQRLERRGASDCARWHKPSTWRDMERLLERYGGCTDYNVADVPKVVVDTTACVGVEEQVSFVLEFIASCGGHKMHNY